jgi:hypothetical protein
VADLCTLADVKIALKQPGAADDAFIGQLITGVSDWIQEYTGRVLTPLVAQTYTVDTGSGSQINVPIGIRTVTSLSIAATDQPDTGGVYTAVAAADIMVRPSPMDRKPGWPGLFILVRGTTARLSAALNGAVIVGDFGFAATPAEINRLAIEAVSLAYLNRRPSSSGGMGEGGSESIGWADFFRWGSPQRQTLLRFRAGLGIA